MKPYNDLDQYINLVWPNINVSGQNARLGSPHSGSRMIVHWTVMWLTERGTAQPSEGRVYSSVNQSQLP